MPPAGAESGALPVVINFHGGGGNAETQQKFSRMDILADAEGFLAVYPNGTGRMPDRLLTWNAGTCCAYSVINKIDDVGFTLALLARGPAAVRESRARLARLLTYTRTLFKETTCRRSGP